MIPKKPQKDTADGENHTSPGQVSIDSKILLAMIEKRDKTIMRLEMMLGQMQLDQAEDQEMNMECPPE